MNYATLAHSIARKAGPLGISLTSISYGRRAWYPWLTVRIEAGPEEVHAVAVTYHRTRQAAVAACAEGNLVVAFCDNRAHTPESA